MDYETISKGRRRNWDPLKPDEVREREKQEERERKRAEREARGKRPGFFNLRARMLQQEASADRERYRQALKQSVALAGMLVLVIVGWVAVEHLVATRFHKANVRQADEYEQMLARGQVISDQSDPVAAFASWRSAWIKGDMDRLTDMFSQLATERYGGSKRRADIRSEFRQLWRRGALQKQRDIAEAFSFPDVVRVPRRPWSDQELAIFRSQPIQAEENATLERFIVAFSYDSGQKKWMFADMRSAEYFSVKWDYETMIAPLSIGPGAVRYDDDGNMLSVVEEQERREAQRPLPLGARR